MVRRALIPTSAQDEVLQPACWNGLTVIWRSASHTPEDIVMPETGVGISLVGDEGSRWRIGRGATQTSLLEPGSVFVFAGEDFTWAENTTPYAGVALGFDLPLLRRTVERAGLNGSAVQLQSRYFYTDERLLSLVKLMGEELKQGGLGGALYQESLATATLIHLIRHYAGVEIIGREKTVGLTGMRLRRVLEYINDNLGQPLTLTELAAVANMSPFHFARRFKVVTGSPPHKYVRAMRMDRAKTMLGTSSKSMAEIAGTLGYTNLGHFVEQFRRAYGVTPRVYRAGL